MWAKQDSIELAFFPTMSYLKGQLFHNLQFYCKGTADVLTVGLSYET